MQPHGRVSEAEYIARERAAETRHELVNGEVHAMAGASPRHNLVALNLGAELRNRLKGRCLVLGSDQRVHVSDTGMFTYPDLSVVCGKPTFHPRFEDTLTDPAVLIEILSESTEAYDRGAKFAHYRTLPSLRQYVLVSPTERRVEVFRKNEAGRWELSEWTSGEAEIADVAVPLDEIYAGVEQLEA
jgi:Uma2 family endonuclease